MKKPQKNKRNLRLRSAQGDAARAILDVAERLAQTRGYNGFSYADIAVELGVTKASLHYHFPSKEALGCALITRYEADFGAALASIDRTTENSQEKLRQYVGLYDSVARNDRMCLCGMLAAEYSTLPTTMQSQLRRFFDMNERWLTQVLEDGSRSEVLRYQEAAIERARMLLGALEGAMLVAQSYGDPQRFQVAAEHLLKDLGADAGAARSSLA